MVWTFLVGLALWWLLQPGSTGEGARTWVMHRGDAAPQPLGEKVRDWFRLVDLNFQRVYPWILLGPYVACLAWYYSLERGRFGLSLPVHVGACALFVLASYAINTRSSLRVARMVIITSLTDEQLYSGEKTNRVRVEVSETSSGPLAGESLAGGRFTRRSGPNSLPDLLSFNHHGDHNSVFSNYFPKFEGGPPDLPILRPLTTLLDLIAYGAIIGLAHSVHFYRRFREREHRALFLESNLAKARLGALQAQLHPHFLFNSLNAVVTLVRRDPKLAEAMLTSLSDLLRLTLSQSERQEVSLREELNFVERYMEIQQTRFGDRLHFERTIQPTTLESMVPTLLLQPLLENAIRHGIEPAERPGLVRLSAFREQGSLVLVVEDDGVGLTKATQQPPTPSARILPGSKARNGIGLPNLRARLEALYAGRYGFDISSPTTGGVLVRIEIPFRREGPSQTAEAVEPQ